MRNTLPLTYSTDSDWKPESPPCLDGIDEIFLDCETTGLEWWNGDLPIGLAVGLPDGRTYYLPTRHCGGNLDEEQVKRWAKRELRNKRITNLNTRFDIHNLYNWGVNLEEQDCTVSDVAHYAALLDDHRKQFSLEALSREFLNEGKIEQVDIENLKDHHAADIQNYARRDVELVRKLKNVFWPMLTQQELHKVRQLEDEIIFVVCDMERNAAPIDTDKLKLWYQEVSMRIAKAHNDLFQKTGLAVDPKKRTEMDKLFRHLNLKSPKITETGQDSYASDVLKKINHPIIGDCIKLLQLKDIFNKYLNPYMNTVNLDDGLLRYALHQLRTEKYGTISGRFSSSPLIKNVGANIQNVFGVEKQIEKGYGEEFLIRDLFIPANGLWFSADASQIEYRLFVHYSGSKKLIEAYRRDPLTNFHKWIWNEMIRPYNPNMLYKPVKNLNFAKIYGAGREKVAEMIELPQSESDKFVDLYDREFPEANQLLQLAMKRADYKGYVHTYLGRRCRFPDKKRLHKALNAIIQGTAADIMKQKLIELFKHRKKLEITLRFPVHDEVDGDCPDEQTALEVQKILNEQTFELDVPILWKMNTGLSWGECDRKAATV